MRPWELKVITSFGADELRVSGAKILDALRMIWPSLVGEL